MTVRALVNLLENAVIDTVAGYGIEAYGRCDARGVYVGTAKLAALGLRVRRHCTYHGIAINVAMDLEPYSRINPCGYESLQVTQLSELCDLRSTAVLEQDLRIRLTAALSG
jgi:lipoyl(octanoyl) transferase